VLVVPERESYGFSFFSFAESADQKKKKTGRKTRLL